MKKIIIVLQLTIWISLCQSVKAQVALSGVINRYWQVTAFTAASGGTCSSPATPATTTIGSAFGAASPASLAAGMEVMIIQMKAGSSGVINRTNTSAYGDVSNLGGAGNYEFATIQSVSGSTITFTQTLVNTYDPAGKVQLIPTWLGNTSSTNYTTSGTITPLAWSETNGVGGVVVLSTSGNLTLSNNINADGMGFKEGDTIGDAYSGVRNIHYACCGQLVAGGGDQMDATNDLAYFLPYSETDQRCAGGACGSVASACSNTAVKVGKGARKGFGIFGRFTGEELSWGKVANGGGGGHGYNSGGGGGGGYNGGGNGGYELAWACNNNISNTPAQPGGLDHGGRGGLGMTAGTTTLFMGGGGGAGHGDGASSSTSTTSTQGYPIGTFKGPAGGGVGGGIAVIKAGSVTGGGMVISAKGTTAIPALAVSDGSGGGGGGGNIILEVPSYSGTLTLDASGGKGGSVVNTNSADCHGTAGGGGAGKVILSVGSAPAGVTINANGGAAGKLLYLNGSSFEEKTSTQGLCNATVNWGAVSPSSVSPLFSTPVNTQICTTPVTLLDLSATFTGDNTVGVYWKTASEKNSSYYAVERSSDGQNFEVIGTLQAQGNSNQIVSYSFTDKNVSTSSGYVYYRLRMVDLDGTFEYSKTVSLKLKGTVISVFPNPVRGEGGINIVYLSDMEGELIADIVDFLGRHINGQTVKLVKGSNQFRLSTDGLSKGIYLVYLNDNYGKAIEKIIIE